MDKPARPTLNIVGPGRLGRSLARIVWERGQVAIGGIVGRSPVHTGQAVAFIGDGAPADWDSLPPADFTLIATPDDALPEVVRRLADGKAIAAGSVVFHCSGALSSAVLDPLRAHGGRIASIHPLFSFADPAQAVRTFAGTWCACEGEPQALDLLHPLFERIGGRCFAIAPEQKTLYHTGAVLACNNLTSLIEAALRCMEAAGVARQIAWPALKPLIEGTLGNIERLGTRTALTGPIARGDAGIVDAQNRALETLDPQLASLYRALGAVALNLAGEGMAPAKRAEVAKALEPPASPARSAG